MSDAFRAEFTGERVIPGSVEDNLFNEHIARYRFAAFLIRQLGLTGTFLDAGCGAGYGSAELAKSGAQVLGIDVSPEAIAHARANYTPAGNTGLRFEQASCTALPVADGAIQLISAFEVIEHLPDWRDFLREANRVLEPNGLFLVSTPNRLYYAESRKNAGPNPYHVHEFTQDEFRVELESVFPHVRMLLQNHVEGISLAGPETGGAVLEISEQRPGDSEAHFFLAVCGKQTLPVVPGFIYIPETGNVLQTRERHIGLLDGEIRQKNEWIEREQLERDLMLGKVCELEAELEEHNRWASELNHQSKQQAALVLSLQDELNRSNEWAKLRDAEAVARGTRVEQLQQELAQATAWAKASALDATERGQRIEALQGELAQATAWATASSAEATERGRRIEQLQAELAQATAWAQASDQEATQRGLRIEQLQEELATATAWAQASDVEAESRGRRVLALQQELQLTVNIQAGYEAAIDQWRRDKEAADRWAMDTEVRLSGERDQARAAFAASQMDLESSRQLAVDLREELAAANARLELANTQMSQIAQSRWVRLGRKLSVGPEIETRQ